MIYPQIYVTPIALERIDSPVEDGIRYRVTQEVTKLVVSGLLPLVTWPGHE